MLEIGPNLLDLIKSIAGFVTLAVVCWIIFK